MTRLQSAIHGATASRVVQELSRHWQYRTDEAGDLALVLVAIEIVYYVAKMLIWVWDRFANRPKQVERLIWRSYRRERVLATYRPQTDPQHPNYGRQP